MTGAIWVANGQKGKKSVNKITPEAKGMDVAYCGGFQVLLGFVT